MPPALLDAIVRYYDPIQFILLGAGPTPDGTCSGGRRRHAVGQAEAALCLPGDHRHPHRRRRGTGMGVALSRAGHNPKGRANMTHSIRVGIVGAGRISDLHAIEYLRNADARIVAVCDQAVELAAAKAAAWGVPASRAFTALDDLLPATRSISSRSCCRITCMRRRRWQHWRRARRSRCRSRWRPGSSRRGRWWRRRSGGRFFKVFENFVFYPPVQRAKALLDEGAIGEPLTIRIKSVFGDPAMAGTSRLRRRPGGSIRHAAAAGRSCSTTGTTSSRWPGGSWACPRRCMPGSAARKSRAAWSTGRR